MRKKPAMTVQDELAHAGAGAPVSNAPDTNSSWQTCSSEELSAIASRGVHGGDLYFAAVAELERRARISEATASAGRAEVAARRRQTIILLLVLFAAVDAALILRFFGF
jgi:hypothetical protein